MKSYSDFLVDVALFANIEKDKIDGMLDCLGTSKRIYKKGETIFLSGDPVLGVGILIRGSVQISQEDVLGNQTILGQVLAGQIFAETIVCAGVEFSPVTTVALVDCEILFLQFKRLVTTCTSACQFHSQLIENMLQILAQKNLIMNRKNRLLSQRSIHEKLKQFFMDMIEQYGSYKFKISFSRNQLADYLCVDRSALSRELSKMQQNGKINFKKNEFEIINL
jgi:CRP-like cAMP-binding protein